MILYTENSKTETNKHLLKLINSISRHTFIPPNQYISNDQSKRKMKTSTCKCIEKNKTSCGKAFKNLGLGAQVFNSSPWEAEWGRGRWISEYKTCPFYIVSSSPPRATPWDPASRKGAGNGWHFKVCCGGDWTHLVHAITQNHISALLGINLTKEVKDL